MGRTTVSTSIYCPVVRNDETGMSNRLRESRARLVAAAVALAILLAVVLVAGLGPGVIVGGDNSGPSVESVSGETIVTISYTDAAGTAQTATVSGVDPALSNPEHDWAIVDRSSLPSALQAVDDGPAHDVVGFGERALVGATETATVPIDGTTLTVVVPAGRGVDPDRKVGFVEAFAGPYSLSGDTDSVVLVSVPDTFPNRGLMYADDRGYVTTESFWDGDAHSVWIHEYIHARQDFRTADSMTWFREASARYLSQRFMQEQYDGVTKSDVRAALAGRSENTDVTLANRTTWAGTNSHYHAGARLLAAIDAEIRAASEGKHTLVDVFRAMNAEDKPVTVERFVELVERRTESDQSWISDAIEGDRPIPERYE